MFGKQSLLLLLDNVGLSNLLLSLSFLFCLFGLSLLLVDNKLILPELFHLTLVFLLAHTSSLSVHLLETLILGELLHELALELLLHAFLFLSTFSLKSELVLAGSLELFSDANPLLSLSPLLRLSCLLALLDVEVVAELLLELLLGRTLLLLGSELLEDAVTDGLSLLLHRLDLILTGLLLLSVPADHFIFILIHLRLAPQECALLVLREDHIGLRLFFLLLNDTRLLVVFLDHALNNGIDLALLPQVLIVCLLAKESSVIDLLLDLALVAAELVKFLLGTLALKLVTNLLVLQHSNVNSGILFLNDTIEYGKNFSVMLKKLTMSI